MMSKKSEVRSQKQEVRSQITPTSTPLYSPLQRGKVLPTTGGSAKDLRRKKWLGEEKRGGWHLASGICLLSCILHLASCIFLWADFEELGAGARPLGMGNAFVGLSDDARATVYNPAGLAILKRSEIAADYARLFMGLDDKSDISQGFIAYVQPLTRRKSLEERVRDLRRLTAVESSARPADSQVEFSTAPIATQPHSAKKEITFFKDWGTAGVAFSNLTLSGAVSENVVHLSYGRKIIEKLSAGLTTKILTQSYAQDLYTRRDPVFEQGNRNNLSQFSFDIGLLYNFHPRLFWGLTATNLSRPNVALRAGDKESLPMAIKNGLALRDKRMRAGLDFVYEERNYRIHAGAERWFKSKTFALRGGGSIGSRDIKNITFGMSANWDKIQVDYAFLYPISGVSETLGNHRVSFVYRFGRAPLDELETGSIELYYAKLQAEAELLRARLEKAEDERSRLERVLVEEALSRIKERVRAEKLEAERAPTAKKEATARSAPLVGISPTASGMKTYVTSKGDTLQSISELFFGKKERWMEIFNLNRDKVGRGGSIKPGTVLLIPGVSGAATTIEEVITPQVRTAPMRLEPAKENSQSKPEEPQVAPMTEGTTLAPVKANGSPRRLADTSAQTKSRASVSEPQARPKTYTVLPGDTLNSIAQKVYGDSKRWKEIYNANKDKVERGSVNPGTVLTIP